jgi:hypothetical protein
MSHSFFIRKTIAGASFHETNNFDHQFAGHFIREGVVA